MAEPLRIEPTSGQRYETLVPMIAAYRGFYEAEERGSPMLEWSTPPTTRPPSVSTTQPAPGTRPGSSTS